LHKKDQALLEMIKSSLGGVGNIVKHGKDSIQFQVSSVKGLSVIINHFYKYPLITQKRADYVLFKQAFNLISNKEYLTNEGLQKLVAIKASMNKGLSEALREAFPNLTPIDRPLIEAP
jgi:hypothetical protein